jgi:predicted phosphodiesterase
MPPAKPPENIGVIGDTHEPFCLPGYLDFCHDTFKKYKCKHIVHIGDEVDNHALSYHEHCPDGMSPEDEASAAMQNMKRWYKAFPEVKVCVGNHSALPFRQATTAGLPSRFLRAYHEVWESPPGWQWRMNWHINNVLFKHGTGTTGPDAHMRQAMRSRSNTVIGHVHAHAGIRFHASDKDIIWGLNTGCGIDWRSYAFAYAREHLDKPVIGCSVILEGGRMPLFIPMKLT